MIRRFLRAFLARTRDSYSAALWFRLQEQLTEAKQELAEAEAGLRVAEAENRRLWQLSELHEARIEGSLAREHQRAAQARTGTEILSHRPEDLL